MVSTSFLYSIILLLPQDVLQAKDLLVQGVHHPVIDLGPLPSPRFKVLISYSSQDVTQFLHLSTLLVWRRHHF